MYNFKRTKKREHKNKDVVVEKPTKICLFFCLSLSGSHKSAIGGMEPLSKNVKNSVTYYSNAD